jgi:predicted acylesterase/phospholipase RssA
VTQPDYKQRLNRFLYFFPFQLLVLHLKNNHLILLFWIVFTGIVTSSIGTKYGLQYLFLYPEYLGEVNLWSHAILGFSCGGFIMAFNIYTYVMHGYKFGFIATVRRPFYKFSINNFLLPAIFIIIYLYNASAFQINKELKPWYEVIINMLGFMGGMCIFFFFSFYYFFKTNKDLYKISGKSEEAFEEELKQKGVYATFHKKMKWYELLNSNRHWRVDTYLSSPYKISLARDSRHYDDDLLQRVLAQNNINASIFEIVMVASFLILGSLGEHEIFVIPAGASIFLVVTMMVMIISAIFSWLRAWTFTFIIILFIILNYLSQHTELFAYKNFAYGLNYNSALAPYSGEHIRKMNQESTISRRDYLLTLETLNKWKEKNIIQTGKKPKLVVLSVSGGGLRNALWSFHVMQKIDSALNNHLMVKTHFITGASGGIIGAAYYRELYLKFKKGIINNLNDELYADKIAKDILNPVSFTIATNDIFIRYRHFEDGPYRYTIDRGYMFEKYLNKNLDSVFTKRLNDYVLPEKNSEIPTLMLSPTIINDGRRLIITSQPVAFIGTCMPGENLQAESSDEYVEFTRMFQQQDAYNLRFCSALRMSASFPYVMPMVTLPSYPAIEVMDAGYRDNYGIRVALRYLFVFREWINTNTDGVVFIQIRDREKIIETHHNKNSLFKRIVKPLGNVYDNIFYTQDFDNDQLMLGASAWLNCKIDVVNFYLLQKNKNKVSLSWHLTEIEKQDIKRALYDNEHNLRELKRLQDLLNSN